MEVTTATGKTLNSVQGSHPIPGCRSAFRGRRSHEDNARCYLNAYAYVENDPINFVDPLGLDEEPPPIVVTGSRCPSGWTCYDPGYGFQTLERMTDLGSEIVVTGSPRRRRSPRPMVIGILPVLNHETLYKHYNYGEGLTICLTPGQFENVSEAAIVSPGSKPSAPDLQGNYTQQIRLYGSAYGYVFGTATGRFNEIGTMIGFYDRFNLDAKDWGERSYAAEAATRFGLGLSTVMTLGGAQPYDVNYPC